MKDTDPGDLSIKKKRYIIISNLAALAVMVALLVGAAVMTINAYYGMSARNVLLDCVEPTGECFKEGQSRTGDVVQQLIEQNNLSEVATRRIVLLAAVCADDPEVRTEPDKARRIILMDRCINVELDKEDRNVD